MSGPCGWRHQQGQLSISSGGEGTGSIAPIRWTVLLAAPGPVSHALQREQEESLRKDAELRKSLNER